MTYKDFTTEVTEKTFGVQSQESAESDVAFSP
jgi:hypothetical protein